MKCFLPCFSSSKRQNHFSSNNTIQFQPTHHDTDLEESIHWISQSKTENEQEKSQCDLETKEKTLKEEKITTPQSQCCIHEEEEEKQECSDSLFSVSITCGKPVSKEEEQEENAENEVNSSTPIKLHHAKDESMSEEHPNEAKDFDEKARPMNQSILEYRYQDCSDDGYDDINLDGDDLCNDKTWEKEEEERSSESSLFSLSTDHNNCRKRISFSSTTEKEVSSRMVPTQEESEGNNDDACSSMLNPIENVSSQGKIVKVVKETIMLHSVKKDKENMNWNQAETSLNLKVLSSNRKMKEIEEIGVDTSLSSWLVESENHTPKNVCYDEDRPILGELKVEEIRKYSPKPNVSSKSSTSLSPEEETPIIGSVGSYWNHSGKTRSSKSNKFGKDGKQDWSSTTIIKTRLEPAFEASVPQN